LGRDLHASTFTIEDIMVNFLLTEFRRTDEVWEFFSLISENWLK